MSRPHSRRRRGAEGPCPTCNHSALCRRRELACVDLLKWATRADPDSRWADRSGRQPVVALYRELQAL